MAYDENLAKRVRTVLARRQNMVEKRMFGGLAFLANGNMSVGILGEELIVRMDPADAPAALRRDGVRVFDITGRPMKGWVMVSAKVLADRRALADWIGRGVDYARSLPPK